MLESPGENKKSPVVTDSLKNQNILKQMEDLYGHEPNGSPYNTWPCQPKPHGVDSLVLSGLFEGPGEPFGKLGAKAAQTNQAGNSSPDFPKTVMFRPPPSSTTGFPRNKSGADFNSASSLDVSWFPSPVFRFLGPTAWNLRPRSKAVKPTKLLRGSSRPDWMLGGIALAYPETRLQQGG